MDTPDLEPKDNCGQITNSYCPLKAQEPSRNQRHKSIENALHIRIIIAKPGLDGHDRGAKVLAAAFRDAGFEVIYLGLRQTPEMIVEAALQEDADVIALSILSGAHMTIFPRVLGVMKAQGLDDVLLVGGGIMPPEEIEELEKMGVGKLFGPGTPVSEPIQFIRNWYSAHHISEVS